jgi:hypothetical protein
VREEQRCFRPSRTGRPSRSASSAFTGNPASRYLPFAPGFHRCCFMPVPSRPFLSRRQSSSILAMAASRNQRRPISSASPRRQEEAPPGYSIDTYVCSFFLSLSSFHPSPPCSIIRCRSVGPMYRFERSLPQLPVPTLLETAAKYLESVKPLVSDPSPTAPTVDGVNGNGGEYGQAQEAIEEFIASPLVRELQERLKARAKETDNWIADWWDDAAYFGVRDPNVPGVNYFYVCSSCLKFMCQLALNRISFDAGPQGRQASTQRATESSESYSCPALLPPSC